MIAIVDKRIPLDAKIELKKRFTLFELESRDIVYPAISGHPDIFMHLAEETLVIAPNATLDLISFLNTNSIPFIFGEMNLGYSHPETSYYNAISTSQSLLHNIKYTDAAIKNNSSGKKIINVRQSYTRCNVIPLQNEVYITSDKGIYTTLKEFNISTYLFSPKSILLEGFQYGFIGGCAGVIGKEIYFIGNLDYYLEGERLRKVIKELDYRIIELYDGPLFDGGGILFVESHKKSD